MPRMWFPQDSEGDWTAAEAHLRAASPQLARMIDLVGPCTLAPRKDYFVVLCKAIFTQQISTAVATVLFGRFRDKFPSRRPTPALVLTAMKRDPEAFVGCGLSRQKRTYVRDLSEHFTTNQIPTRKLAAMSDDDVVEALVKVKGIGRWTAEMFLIFTLNRPDVLPVDDLGLQQGAQKVFGLRKVPDKKALTKLAEPWRPYRSIATWYIWRGVSKMNELKKADANGDGAPAIVAGRATGGGGGAASASRPRRSPAARRSPAPARRSRSR
jgi:DNA-3-methyladenine glycosylase II